MLSTIQDPKMWDTFVHFYKDVMRHFFRVRSQPAGYPRIRMLTPNPPGIFGGVLADEKKHKRIR